MRWLLLVLLGCDTSTEAPIDPPDADLSFCATAPLSTWETFGRDFLRTFCQGCHATTTPERLGAPADVHFDDEAAALAWGERILLRAAVDPPTMPPAGGTSAEDHLLLRAWLVCAAGFPDPAP